MIELILQNFGVSQKQENGNKKKHFVEKIWLSSGLIIFISFS